MQKETLKEKWLYNTQFRTKKVIPNVDLMESAFLEQEMVKFWQNGVFNTQFTTKKVNLNLFLMQNKKVLNLWQNAVFQHKIM